MPGTFVPHIRMMDTGYQDTELACEFGLPYVVVQKPRPFDTATLNYNWQVGGTAAFSVYTNATESIDEQSAEQGMSAVLRFLSRMGIIKYKCHGGYMGTNIDEDDMMNVKCGAAGIYRSLRKSGDEVEKGELLAQIVHPYEGAVVSEVRAPADGILFFAHESPLVMENTIVFKMIKRLHK